MTFLICWVFLINSERERRTMGIMMRIRMRIGIRLGMTMRIRSERGRKRAKVVCGGAITTAR